MPNKVKEIWKSGGASINGWLAIPNGFTAGDAWPRAGLGLPGRRPAARHSGLPIHGDNASRRSRRHPAHAHGAHARGTSPASSARCSTRAPPGVICPMVNTAARGQAPSSRIACYYPPQGRPQQRPDPRRHVRRVTELPEAPPIPGDAVHPHDRNAARRSKTSKPSSTCPASTPSISGRPISASPIGLIAADGPGGEADPRRSTTRSSPRPAKRGIAACLHCGRRLPTPSAPSGWGSSW